MVQYLLSTATKRLLKRATQVGLLVVLLLAAGSAAKKTPKPADQPHPPDLLLEGGRKLTYERSFSSEKEAKGKPGFWGKLVNAVAGEAEPRGMVRPYSIVVDSRGRAIVTDPGGGGVHIFDLAGRKYKFLERNDKRKEPMLSPQCVALDAEDNIYVTDSEAGKIFVFHPDGKYLRTIGSLRGGEGFFKRPTGIAVDSAQKRIYITDTLRDRIYILDWQGQVINTIGERGTEEGRFNFPTELRLQGD